MAMLRGVLFSDIRGFHDTGSADSRKHRAPRLRESGHRGFLLVRYDVMKVIPVVLGLLLVVAGCNEPKVHPDDRLLTVGQTVLTAGEFERELEVGKAAYSHNELMDPKVLGAIKRRLLKQLTEQMVLLERARELGIEVADEEVEAASRELLSAYSEDELESEVLKNAVSMQTWRKGLKDRLIAEKLVQRELTDRMELSADEIRETLHRDFGRESLEKRAVDGSEELVDQVIRRLKTKKAEEAYADWYKSLAARYPIVIDQALWDRILGA